MGGGSVTDSLFPRTAALSHDLIVLDEVASTNQYLVDHPGNPDRVRIVVSTNQTAGRGRLGRRWVSPAGSGVAVSVALPRQNSSGGVDVAFAQRVSLISGAAVAEVISAYVDARVQVKWPNDVWVEGKKVAGILGEISPDARIIVGVGLNIDLSDSELPTPDATSLRAHGANPNGLADRFVADFVTVLLERSAEVTAGLPIDVRQWVEGTLATLGVPVTVDLPTGQQLVGTAESIHDDGSLAVRDQAGVVTVVTAGDVHHLRHLPTAT